MSNSLSAARAALVLVRAALSIDEDVALQIEGRDPSSSESPADVLARHPKPVIVKGRPSGEGTWALQLSSGEDSEPPPVWLSDFPLLNRLVRLSEGGGIIEWTDGGQVVQLGGDDVRELVADYGFSNLFFTLTSDDIADDRAEGGRWLVRVSPPGIISTNVDDITDDETLKEILLREARKRSHWQDGE